MIIFLIAMYVVFGFAIHFTWKAIFDPGFFYPGHLPGRRATREAPHASYSVIAFFGFFWFASAASYQSLFWMPDEWGWNGDDGWMSIRSYIASGLGMVIGGVLIYALDQLAQGKIENAELKADVMEAKESAVMATRT